MCIQRDKYIEWQQKEFRKHKDYEYGDNYESLTHATGYSVVVVKTERTGDWWKRERNRD